VLNAEVGNILHGVVKAIREVGPADDQRQLHDLPHIIVFAQLFRVPWRMAAEPRVTRSAYKIVAFSFSSKSGERW
jgi:hypothetical protein